MEETYQMVRYLFKHDPYVIGGLLLIGLASVLFMHIQLKMLKLGYKSYTFFKISPTATNGWNMPSEYLRIRNKHGWSPWPVYLLWPSLVTGVAVFVIGLLRL
jgi:hypothetical protein